MRNLIKLLLFSIVLIIIICTSKAQITKVPIPIHKEEIYNELSRLWIDNVIYTRLSILCLTDRLPGTEETKAHR